MALSYHSGFGNRNPFGSRREPAYDPVEQEGLLRKLTAGAAGGIAKVGNLLSLPGSSVLDLLHGEGLNSFDQWMTPFSSENRRTSGDVLRKWGAIGQDSWKNWLGRFAMDIVTDPITYALPFMPFATVGTKGMQVAKKLGIGNWDDIMRIGAQKGAVGIREAGMKTALREITPDAMLPDVVEALGPKWQQLIDEPLRKSMGLAWNPISEPFVRFNPLGQAAGEKIARGYDILGKAISESLPGRVWQQAFSPAVKDVLGKGAQAFGRRISSRETAALYAANKGVREAMEGSGDFAALGTRGHVEKMVEDNYHAANKMMEQQYYATQGIVNPTTQVTLDESRGDFMDLVRHHMEVGHRNTPGTADPLSAGDSFRDYFRLTSQQVGPVPGRTAPGSPVDRLAQWNALPPNYRDAVMADVDEAAKRFRVLLDKSREDLVEKGAIIGEVDNTIGYAPRYGLESDEGPLLSQIRMATRGQHFTHARDPIKRDVPELVLRHMTQNPDLRKTFDATTGQLRDLTPDERLTYIVQNYGEYLDHNYRGYTDSQATDMLTRWIDNNRNEPYFGRLGRPTAQNIYDNGTIIPPRLHHAKELGQWVMRSSPTSGIYETGRLFNHIGQYARSVRYMDRTLEATHDHFAIHAKPNQIVGPSGTTISVPLREAFQALENVNPNQAMEYFAKVTKQTPADVENLHIPIEEINSVKSVMDAFRKPEEWMETLGKVMDVPLNTMRAHLTLPTFAFHARNAGTGHILWLLEHVHSPKDVADYLRANVKAWRARGDRTNDLTKEIMDAGVITGERGVGYQDVKYGVEDPLINLMTHPKLGKVAGLPGQGYKQVMRAGNWAMEFVEYFNRVPGYSYLRDKGWSPIEAAKEVHRLQFDYSKLTKFERNVAKRAFLFYTFSSRMAPLLFDMLMNRPGGAMGRMIIGFSKGQGTQGQPVPEWIRETSGVALPDSPTGEKRFVTGFGLPFEDPLGFSSSPLHAPFYQELLSRSNPFLKMAVEMGTGSSLFQRGRPIEEMTPTLARTAQNIRETVLGAPRERHVDPLFGSPKLEFLASNNPFSRHLTQLRTFFDPRKSMTAKAMILGTGIRITDVSPQAQDQEITRLVTQGMRKLGGQVFAKPWIPQYRLERMSPTQLEEAAELQALAKMTDTRMKERSEMEKKQRKGVAVGPR